MPSSNIKRKKKPGPVNNAPNNGGGGNFTETAMDDYLARLDLYRKPIAKDGSCLFRAVSEQVYNCQAKHLQVRKDCIDFMRRNRDKFEAFLEGPFDHHLFRLQNPKEWAGQVEISALSLMYKKDFVVYQDINAEPTKVTDNNFKDKIMLCYSNGNHYDAVYDVKFQKNAAMCQSLVYEILYQKVFAELDRKYNSSKGPKQNPGNDVNSVMTSYYQNGLTEDDAFKEDSEDNSGWTEVVRGRSNKAKSARQNRAYDQEEPKEEPVKPNLDQKHGWQAKRSLDNELYRNVELEAWEESKNVQEQQDQSYAASIQYQPGDKCFAWLGQPDVADKVYEAIVKYYLPVQGNIEVKIPELGNKCFLIPLQNLNPTENQQELNYRELSGFYKKAEAGGGPPTNEGLRDDGKRGRRRNMQGRPQRGYKGDEHGEDTAARKGFQDESFPRQRSGPGQRDKFGRGRGRGRYPRGRDERQLQKEDEEAKQIAEQAKLAELQGKDPAAFPALPTQQAEEKPPSTEAAPDQSPAEFWSRLKNTQGKQPPVTPKENHVNLTENKPPSVPTSPTDQQAHTAKSEEKELETKKEKPLTKEVKAPVTPNSEVESLEASHNHVSPETGKKEQIESQKQALFLEKEQLKGNVDLSKGGHVNEIKPSPPTVSSSGEVKGISSKSNVEEMKFADVVEPRGAWGKDTTERRELKTQEKTSENNAKEIEPEVKKSDESLSVKPQGVRGVIRMTNLNSKPQQSADSEEQEEVQKEEIKLLRKEDSVTKEGQNLKSALAGEGSSASSPEKKTVTFAEPVKEGGEIKVLVSTAKDLAGKDGKREVLAPPTLVSVVMKPAPTLDIAEDNLPVTLVPSKNPVKTTSEDDATNTKNSTPTTPDANTKPQTTTLNLSDSSQGSEGAEPVPSSSPSVSQHQAVYQLPFLPVMYTQLPNMTSHPRLPQGISVESDGSDLPEDPNTLRYFFNLGFQYHVQLNNQQWANQQMYPYYPSIYQMPSQDHMQPHPAVSMGQQLSPAVPQMIYQQQMQGYHPAQIPPVMQENPSFSDRNSLDRSSPNLSQQQQQQSQQQQQQQQPQQQQPIPLHQAPAFVPNHHPTWRTARSMTGYQGKQMQMGGYNSQGPNQQTPRGPMQQGAGNSKPHYKNKKYQKHRNDQFQYGAQSQHAQNQGAHAYPNASQPAGSSSNAFYMTGSEHAAGKGSGDYYHGNQQFVNFHGNVSSSMTQAPHSAANSRGQYP